MTTLPLVLEPAELHVHLSDEPLIVDMRGNAAWSTGHIPGSVPLEYAAVVSARPPVVGLLPQPAQVADTLASLGLRPGRAVIAYDDEGGGRAARLLFTLEAFGHNGALALLDGGLEAWRGLGHALATGPTTVRAGSKPEFPGRDGVAADKHYILQRLGRADVALLDTRSLAEYSGADARSARGGHIPGAVNLNWTDLMDIARDFRLLPDDRMRAMLEALGVTPEREVIVYCQSHHRSAHTYWALRHLGYPRVRGYPGAWSDWGNDPALPVETGS